MSPSEQLELVNRHYALNGARNYDAAQELLTEDFVLEIPSFMPFGGVYRGKGAFREAIPIVARMAAVTGLKFVATTVGENCAVEIVEFTLAGHSGAPVRVAEFIQFRGNQICRITPFYSDPHPFMTNAPG
jgi:ketosteroid isomerase-like protein